MCRHARELARLARGAAMSGNERKQDAGEVGLDMASYSTPSTTSDHAAPGGVQWLSRDAGLVLGSRRQGAEIGLRFAVSVLHAA